MSGRDFVREIPVDFSNSQQHDVLATLWARTRIDDLMSKDFKGAQQGNMQDEVKQAITQLGLDYRLMTQFTSFVAVEEMIVTDGGQPRRIDVPVEVPEGVNREGVFGKDKNDANGYGFQFFAGQRGRQANILPNQPPTASLSARVLTPAEVSALKTKAPPAGGGGGGAGIGAGQGSGAGAGTAPPSPSSVNGAFAIDGSRESDVRALTPEEQKRAQLKAKFHPSVLAVIDRLKDAKASPGPDEGKFIRNGKAEVQIWLTDKSDETLAKLKELGFEVVLDPKTAKMVIGRLPIEKLAALAELKSVRYVAPQM
jgi:Ca-activated chloride channel family protein